MQKYHITHPFANEITLYRKFGKIDRPSKNRHQFQAGIFKNHHKKSRHKKSPALQPDLFSKERFHAVFTYQDLQRQLRRIQVWVLLLL